MNIERLIECKRLKAMLLHEALESLRELGVHSETCSESPTSWRVTASGEVAGMLVEYLLLSVPGFRLDYVYEWETKNLLVIQELREALPQ